MFRYASLAIVFSMSVACSPSSSFDDASRADAIAVADDGDDTANLALDARGTTAADTAAGDAMDADVAIDVVHDVPAPLDIVIDDAAQWSAMCRTMVTLTSDAGVCPAVFPAYGSACTPDAVDCRYRFTSAHGCCATTPDATCLCRSGRWECFCL